jgi:lipopolysaccharide/colanic/teichoic acid biosynthesis glycosyltransferase
MEKVTVTNRMKSKAEHDTEVGWVYCAAKRVFDIVVGAIGMIPVLLVSIVLLPFYMFGKDRGPLFFKQRRIGQNGKAFYIYKFRSMIVNAEEVLKSDKELYAEYVANSFKLPNGKDPRITKLGNFLRKSSLDEIPQFINILKGDMSFIGPRPVIESELEEYGENVDVFLKAKPGAMGLWQASGRSDIRYPERAHLEIYYVKNRSLWMDVKIMFKNVIAIFHSDGAY